MFRWSLFARDDAGACASNGIEIAVDHNTKVVPGLDLLLVCAGTADAAANDVALCNWLRAVARRGAALGGISLGPYALARAGLLDGRRCALHWENLSAFAEAFPRVRCTPDLFVIDGDRYTCAGGTAALDMMLQVIMRRHGRNLAYAVSEQFIHPRIRGTDDPQRMPIHARLGIRNEKLAAAIAIMESTDEEPGTVQEIARAIGLSSRQLERLFAKHVEASPSHYALRVRLDRARTLLLQTTKSVLEVAVICGFGSASHFSRCYRMAFGHKPSAARATLLAGTNARDGAAKGPRARELQ